MPRIFIAALAATLLSSGALEARTTPILNVGCGLAGGFQQGPTSRPSSRPSSTNPARPGFDKKGSDERATALADVVMEHLGGRAAWDATRFLTWRFFGSRLHVWDRKTGDIRVEGKDRRSRKPYVILMNLKTRKGRAFDDGVEVKDPEALQRMLERGRGAWINDSYWMFMPYKLKDSGVTLKYVGTGKTKAGAAAEILQLTFKKVGVSPQNKYQVYVGQQSGLVEQWDFFSRAEDKKPRMSTPWTGWKRYGGIMLSDGRGGGRGHTQIAVLTSLPRSVFTSPQPPQLGN